MLHSNYRRGKIKKQQISESIFSGKTTIIPLADVQHAEKHGEDGLCVITKNTKWNVETDYWANNIYLSGEEKEEFMKAWMQYRYELDIKPYEKE